MTEICHLRDFQSRILVYNSDYCVYLDTNTPTIDLIQNMIIIYYIDNRIFRSCSCLHITEDNLIMTHIITSTKPLRLTLFPQFASV